MSSLDSYANSMFRHEVIHRQWIESCTRYLKFLFGDTLKDKIVCDYGFGRGNWTLAFLSLGVKKVYAIEASASNVQRFSDYCKIEGVQNVEVLYGNFVERAIPIETIDFFWLYGVFQHIPRSDKGVFLSRVKDVIDKDRGSLYLYNYNSESLREFIVTESRKYLRYDSEGDFLADSALFLRRARARAKDDLVAPVVEFSSSEDLIKIVQSYGFSAQRQDPDFQEFLSGEKPTEFKPHQILFSSIPTKAPVTFQNVKDPFEKELQVLKALWTDLLDLNSDPVSRKKIAIGIFNTHFSAVSENFQGDRAVIEVALFILGMIQHNSSLHPDRLNKVTLRHLDLLAASQQNRARVGIMNLENSTAISEYLVNNVVRI